MESNWRVINGGTELVSLDAIAPHPRNPRQGDVGAIHESIAANGFYGSVVVQHSTGHILAGNHRWLAAKQSGASEIPVTWVDVDDATALRILLADNRTNDLASYDMTELADLLQEIQADAGTLEGTCYDGDALDELLADLGREQEKPADPGAQIDRAEELREKWGTERGQIWGIPSKTCPGKTHRLMCGDSTSAEDVGRLMRGENAALIVTSPPYNQKLDHFKPSGMHAEHNWVANVQTGSYADSRPEDDYQAEQSAALAMWARHLTDTASVFYNHKNRYRDKAVVSPWSWIAASGATVRQEIIWKRPGSVTQNARMFLPCDERVFWLYFGADFYFSDTTEHKTWSSVWEINPQIDREESLHGCAFPLELASRPIAACSRHGDVVLEPYMGSGTTAVAAEQLARVCYGMEISPAYCAVILERLTGMGLAPFRITRDEEP